MVDLVGSGRQVRSRLAVSAILITILSAGATWADSGDPFAHGTQATAQAVAQGAAFLATSTAIVDSDGRVHSFQPGGRQDAPSLFEYRIGQSYSGMCPNDALGQPRDLLFVDKRLIAAGPTALWQNAATFCASPKAQPLDLGNIAAQAATVTQRLTPPTPQVRIQPDGKTLVNNPTVFSGTDLTRMTPPALVNPLSGRALQLTVKPTTWTWDFGDGSPPVTTQGPPPAYQHGGTTDGLLTHAYTRAADVAVTVTVRWTASYTISGVAGTRNVANPVISTTTVALAVRQARTQLVSR